MKEQAKEQKHWSRASAEHMYGITEWGNGYFSISESGEVTVNLKQENETRSLSLLDIAKGLQERGLKMPVLLRFSDILDDRIKFINESFLEAIRKAGYQGTYRGAYPVKVNQQQQVIEEITQFGKQYHHGLETGSKAELIAAMAYLDDPEAYIICNGYKDEEYIDLALRAASMGMQIIIVIEMPGETPLILDRAETLGIEPQIGIRMKPSTIAGGHWTHSGGDRSVFGLNTAQVINAVDYLKEAGKLSSLRLLHYHLGSQIPNIRDIRTGASEAARFYAGLVKEGAPMGLLDIGGGLAIDYDGSQTNTGSSRNYTIQEYCDDIVEVVMEVCGQSDVAHPVIISESGRALVAYYSVLLLNILDNNNFDSHSVPEEIPDELLPAVENLLYIRDTLNTRNIQECLNDLNYYRDEIRTKFLYGTVSMRERAAAEQIYWAVLSQIYAMTNSSGSSPGSGHDSYISPELQNLDQDLSDIYYGNFSLFQSLPDVWAIDQLLPIMPVHKLNEQPERRAILADITCDCDGKIDNFIGSHQIMKTLPVHTLPENEDYILGVFLVGAYQETLGDLHNLLGDTNVVSVTFDRSSEAGILFHHELDGDTVSDVLSYVEYDPKELESKIRRKAEEAVRRGLITPYQRRKIITAYNAGMRGYTYYETDQED